ncbi:Na+/H+ antiporter NhaC family protein [Georgenia alba]|uniref:Na+/H+ antiporter NhaC family protein n=1 Tax=Georgenia alba TaxID=2233858 RepID=A0ABW2Q4B4_9MICO
MEPSILSLLPPLVTIGLAITTKRIIPALAVGIVLGSLMAAGWDVLGAGRLIGEVVSGLVIAEGAIAEEMYISVFVFLLGVLTAFIYLAGGTGAFAEWMSRHVRTRARATLVPVVVGVVLFFDDAFSALVGGNISRSVTDRHRVSRAKLSYLIDSTAAPVIILVPISGWAAFIAATMSGIFADNDITELTGYEAYLQSVPTNFYAITALLFAVAVAALGLNLGPMRRHETRAVETGELWDASRGKVPGEASRKLEQRDDGRPRDLLVPVAILVVLTIVFAAWIGIAGTDGPITVMQVLANTDVILALFWSGLVSCIVAGAMLLARRTPARDVGRAALVGAGSMWMAVVVVFLAWVTAEIISELGIGEYVAGFITGDLAFSLLPAILFLLASFVAFSMGSTFGTFGLILPIAAEIVANVDLSMLIPAFGAVLAGAIFGDHTSPLSDTTILSSIGSGIQVIEHVNTQLPYALVCSASSLVGFVVLGVTQSTAVGLLAALAALALAIAFLRARLPRLPERATARPAPV